MLPALEGGKGAKATLGMPKEGDGKTFEAISEVGRGRVLYEHTAGKKVGLEGVVLTGTRKLGNKTCATIQQDCVVQ